MTDDKNSATSCTITASNGFWWCNSHKRKATHLDKNGRIRCDPKLGGITLPCFVVFLDDIEIDA